MARAIRRYGPFALKHGFLLSVWEGEDGDILFWDMPAGDRTELSHLRVILGGTLQAFGPNGAPRPMQSVGEHSDMLPPISEPGLYKLVAGGQFLSWCLERRDQADYEYQRHVLARGAGISIARGRYVILAKGTFRLDDGSTLGAPVLMYTNTRSVGVVADEDDCVLVEVWV